MVVRAQPLPAPPAGDDGARRARDRLRRRDLRELRRAVLVRGDRPDERARRADDGCAPLLRHGRDRPRLLQSRDLRDPDVDGGRRLRRVRVVDHRRHRRRGRRLLRRLDRQHPHAHHRPRPHAAGARDPADRRRAARPGLAVARFRDPRALLLDGSRAHRARRVPVAAREGVRGGGEGRRFGRHPHHVPPHPSEHARADRRQRHAVRRRGDHRRGGAVVPRLRDQAADAVARLADRQRPAVPAEVVDHGLPGPDAARHRRSRSTSSATASGTRSTRSRGESVPEPVLSIRNLVVEFRTEDGVVHAVDDISYDVYPGRDARHRRRVGLRQERLDDVDPRADPAAAGPHRERDGDVQGQGSPEDEEARAAPRPRRRGRDGLPGSDDVAEPGAEGRLPARRGDQDALPEGAERAR